MQEWKIRHKTAGLENARLENVAQKCRTGIYGTRNPGLENARKVSMESEQTLYIHGQTNVTETLLWKVQSRPDCNSRVKKLEQARNHDDWLGAHRAAATFFLNLCDCRNHKSAGVHRAQ